MTRRGQRVPQPVGILDDSVVHQADSTRAVGMRMCVGLGDRTVGCPPGVTDTHSVEVRAGPLAHLPLERPDPSHRPQPRDVAAGGLHRDPNRVVTAILEPAERDEEVIDGGRMRPASDDAAHHPASRPERAAKKSACDDDAGGVIDTGESAELNPAGGEPGALRDSRNTRNPVVTSAVAPPIGTANFDTRLTASLNSPFRFHRWARTGRCVTGMPIGDATELA